MKLISLNIWGGHVHQPLLNFIKQQQEIDIFCLQEVYCNAPEKISDEVRIHDLDIFNTLRNLLPQHQSFFRPAVNNIYGLAMFVKNTVNVIAEGEVTIHENPNYVGIGPEHDRILQWLQCSVGERSYSILNVHGLWNGKGKTDSPERIAQSQQIKDFLDSINTPKILCGDFNLKPDTESLAMLEVGMTNLIKTHQITSTRTSFYPKAEKFADYILISPEITMNQFQVLPDEVSDHAALYLDFN